MKGIAKNQLIQDSEHVATVVDLMGDLDKRVANFSGGMQRRLSLAIALLGAPDLLILDEPTVGIDPALRQKNLAGTPSNSGCRPQHFNHDACDG